MKIAIIGWGSLIWDQRDLKIVEDTWYEDGPTFPLEFARKSKGGRITLVIFKGWQEVKTLYSIAADEDLITAIESLRIREGTSTNRIGFLNYITGEKRVSLDNEQIILNLIKWKPKNIDAVIWTDLPPTIGSVDSGQLELNDIKVEIDGLAKDEIESARTYIFSAPKQIQTKYRQKIEGMIERKSKSANK